MTIDQQTKDFLQTDKPKTVQGMTADPNKIGSSVSDMRYRQFIKTAGGFAEEIVDFFRDRHANIGSTDDEAVFALALATINLRHAFGSPQAADNKETFDAAAALAHFDAICAQAQKYHDENKDAE